MKLPEPPTFLPIPPTAFLMGTPERELSALAKVYGGTRESYREESPQSRVRLPAFAIAQTPVTNGLYAAFVAATDARPPGHWRGIAPPEDLLAHPVVDVNWHEALAFCEWLNRVAILEETAMRGFGLFRWATRPMFRLPSEAEWELAARGTDGRVFPWGHQWDASFANTSEQGLSQTTPIGIYPQAASPFGCLDMCGNVWEWTSSLDKLYPYRSRDGRENLRADGRRILRGGCYANPHGYARCACRFRLPPDTRNQFLGFRLARDFR